MYVNGENLAIDVKDAQALKARAVAGDPEALRSAARQFESLLITQMLKTMRESSFSDENDPMGGGEGLKLYREMLDQQWAARLSQGKGLGFADAMVKAMESRGMNTPAVNPTSLTGPTNTTSPTNAEIPALPPASVDQRKQQFMQSMKPHAEVAAAATGVPARFILAHAALESGWGEREIKTTSGAASHNLFGIKAGGQWNGDSVQTLTTEYRHGVAMKLEQSFRAYEDYSAGFTDYAQLLKSRYGAAVTAGGDSDTFANGLAAGGYATDPAYASKLKAVIASVAMAGG
jgi:flagellar protein FlgJ